MNTLTKTEEKSAAFNAPNGEGQRFLTPLANILETADGYLLEAEMPGVGKGNLEITIENGELVILGRRGTVPKRGQAIYRESRDFNYRRVFELDPSIDSGKISAHIEQGVLRLHLPKAESVKPRRISVK
jgi:HSP20 family protein